MSKIKNSLKSLEDVLNRTLPLEDKKLFFTELHCFVIHLSDESFQNILKEILLKYKLAKKQVEIAKNEALKEFKSFEKKIRKYILELNIPNEHIIETLESIQKKLSFKESNLDSIFNLFKYIITDLLNNDTTNHSPFIQKHVKIKQINAYKDINDEELFPKYDKYSRQNYYFLKNSKASTAYSLIMMQVFFERYDPKYHDEIIDALKKNGKDSSKLQKESFILVSYIMSENQNPPTLFPSIQEYKIHMQRIVSKLKNSLTEKESLLSQNKKSTEWFYDSKTRRFFSGKKSIRFGKFKLPEKDKKGRQYYGLPSKILNILVNNNKNKKWSNSSLFREIDRCPKNEGMQIYDACRQINLRLASNLNMQNFLDITPECVQINSEYL